MKSELDQCISALRGPLLTAALFSGLINVLALTGAIFMLTVYDRVIPSGSMPTLLVLGLLAAAMYGAYALFDMLRGRMLSRIGAAVGESISPRVYDVVVRRCAARERGVVDAVRDLDRVRSFLSSSGPAAFFDLPWMPVFLVVLFAFHFYIGLSVLIGGVILVGLTITGNFLTRYRAADLAEAMTERDRLVAHSQSGAETIHAMGMTHSVSARWNALSGRVFGLTQRLGDTLSTVTSLSRSIRMALQSFVLAVGALLVIRHEATGGIIIAGSILSARALMPIEQASAQWKNFIAAKQSWGRLRAVLDANPSEEALFTISAPSELLTADGLAVALPNTNNLLVRNISFQMRAGQGLGIIGPTGSGKSTLARALVGLWPPALGTVKLDGEPLQRWTSSQRGRFVGYLPQTVSLLQGTLAENIARFDPDADPEDVVRVARLAGVHELIARMPEGYNTRIDQDGGGLSGGQAQRIALARALFGDPFLIVLDEPNANLDEEGEAALQNAMKHAYARGAIVIVVTHRPSALSNVDHIVVLKEGTVRMFGKASDVVERLSGGGQKKVVAMDKAKSTGSPTTKVIS